MTATQDKNTEKDEARVKETEEQLQEEQTTPETQAGDQASQAEEKPEAEAPQAEAEDAVAKLQAELADSDNRYLRLRADFDNFRRRTRQEKEELGAVVTQNLLKDMLPLIDNFERALAAESKDAQALRKGVEMIYNQLAEALKKNGLEYIETKDKKFDPNFHQAIMRIEDPDKEDDTIAAELQKGYMVRGKVIRPSMVQVVAN